MKDIIYTRKFIDKNGVERKEYINVGMLFEKEGRQSIKLKGFINLASLQNENGEVWLNLYEHKSKETKTQDNGPKTLYKGEETVKAMSDAVNTNEQQQEPKNDDDVPF